MTACCGLRPVSCFSDSRSGASARCWSSSARCMRPSGPRPPIALALQFRFLDTFGRLLRFLVLIRVPLVVLIVAAAFGPLGLGPGASLLGGILDVSTAWGIAATTAACLVLAFACGTQINM